MLRYAKYKNFKHQLVIWFIGAFMSFKANFLIPHGLVALAICVSLSFSEQYNDKYEGYSSKHECQIASIN